MTYKAINTAEVDFSKAGTARKTATVHAVAATVGEALITKLKDGTEETKNVAKPGDMKVTNPSGEQYFIDANTFATRYESTGKPDIYRPVGQPLKFVVVSEDVCFDAPWGEVQNLKAGGVIVENQENGERYGIGRDEFPETYETLTAFTG